MTEAANSEAWGISPGYHDYAGQWRAVPPTTTRMILEAMGAPAQPGAEPPGQGRDDPVRMVQPGAAAPIEDGPWELRTEDGATMRLEAGRLPPDLPLGYHELIATGDGRRRLLVVSPGRCHLPRGLRTWGWSAQLYATRSGSSWGMGDLADLRRLAGWSRRQGAGMTLLNPLHATVPGVAEPSPYYPSSRCFRNPIYLRVEEVPGAEAAEADLNGLAAEGRALNSDRLIDRDRVWKLKATALERLWERFRASGGDLAFDLFREEQGDALTGFAVHCALSEALPGRWPEWPPEYRRPDTAAVARFAAEHAERVEFHAWLQWLTEEQLAAAGAGIDLMGDLAIGVDPSGADAWLWQDTMALSMRVGAPPDEFNTKGQNWSLPPFDPWQLRLAHYEPYVRTLRAGFRAAGGLRFDHVMGLFRLFWIPEGAGPAEGAYVSYRHGELLDILALESFRAGAHVVGEDLGTVEDYMREELAARDVLSYRLLWFEPRPPREFPEKALAAVTTHDLPTVAGLWSGADLAEGQALGLEPNEDAAAAMRQRLQTWTGVPEDASVDEVVTATYAVLAEAPSMILTATLDDALAVEERPNVPGTIDERPNWSLALPVPLERLEGSPTAAAIAAVLNRRPEPEV
jgi:4-alpha-glucanotransferase